MKYKYHDFLTLEDVANEPYMPMVVVGRGMIKHTPHEWEDRLDRAGLLGIINMMHFGRSTEVNACMKQLLACFHGGFLWLDKPVDVIVGNISEITGLPKDELDPS